MTFLEVCGGTFGSDVESRPGRRDRAGSRAGSGAAGVGGEGTPRSGDLLDVHDLDRHLSCTSPWFLPFCVARAATTWTKNGGVCGRYGWTVGFTRRHRAVAGQASVSESARAL